MLSRAPAQQKILFLEGAELPAFLPKSRFRVESVADGISEFSATKKPISVFDRIEELGRAAGKLMCTRLPGVHSEALQTLHKAWLFQRANASQGSRLGMDALVTVCSETRTESWFGHGCSGNRIHSKMNGVMAWAWMLW